MPDARPWWALHIRNEGTATEVAELLIYDQIGESLWSESTTAKGFVEALKAVTAPRINLRINSPGGSVFDGLTIYNALVAHPATVTTYVDGLAASIASVVALAGERVVMASNALFMIHNPWALAVGDAAELRHTADVLDKIRDSLTTTYAARCALTDDELRAALDAETWYSADEALEVGFATEVTAPLAAAASAAFDLSRFRHAPAALTRPPIPAPAAAAAVRPRKDTPMPTIAPAAATEPAATQVPASTYQAGPAAPRWADVVIAARHRHEDPARWAAMQERLAAVQAAAPPLPPGDGVIDIPEDVSGVLPTPIVQEIHSWMRGQRPVASLFGLRGLPFREGPSFTWPYLVTRPQADVQAKPGQAVYKTQLDIDGMPFTKVTVAAQLKAPFQLSWTSPAVVGELGELMTQGYATRFEQLVSADFTSKVTRTRALSFANAGAFADAVLEALNDVNQVTRQGADCIVASYDMVLRVRGLRDEVGRAVYPLVAPSNADGTVSAAGVPVIEGIVPTVGWDLPPETFIVGHTRGYRTFDDGSNFASQPDLTNLADDKVVYGIGAFGPMDMDAFVALEL